jgi:esterase/lipase superfamily enzyme
MRPAAMLRTLSVVAACLLWFSCTAIPSSPSSSSSPPPPLPRHGPGILPAFTGVEVFYATDRRPTGSKVTANYYGSLRSRNLEVGRCTVSIPRDHRMGELESPRWYLFEFSPDPSRDVVLLRVRPLKESEFDRTLRARLSTARHPDLLLFIHGYNVSFEDAARRTAQLAYDLGQEVPVFYSWPSQAELTGYPADEATAEWTVSHLVRFLERLSRVTGTSKINVVAHSMGNRVLINALLRFSKRQPPHKFRNLVFTAPDIDADTFADLASEFTAMASRSTLYASENDKALIASRTFHRAPRAGDAGQNIVVVDRVDTIDASSVETDFIAHSYFGDSHTLISDIFYLLNRSLPPGERSGLERRNWRGHTYWAFLP